MPMVGRTVDVSILGNRSRYLGLQITTDLRLFPAFVGQTPRTFQRTKTVLLLPAERMIYVLSEIVR
jgi:hypothetical protein